MEELRQVSFFGVLELTDVLTFPPLFSFRRAIKKLNDDADELTSYKVIYIARHGEGEHAIPSQIRRKISLDA